MTFCNNPGLDAKALNKLFCQEDEEINDYNVSNSQNDTQEEFDKAIEKIKAHFRSRNSY